MEKKILQLLKIFDTLSHISHCNFHMFSVIGKHCNAFQITKLALSDEINTV